MSKILKHMFNHIFMLLFSILFWCILNESFSVYRMLEGLAVAIITLFCIHFIIKEDIDSTYSVSTNTLIIYFLKLIVSIYISAFNTIIIIFKNNPSTDIIRVTTDIKNDIQKCLFANGITLTPGTVTIDLNGNEITVLKLQNKE